MDTLRQLKYLNDEESAKEWRTLRCLLRKTLKVPREDVRRLKKIGIDRVEALLQVHYAMVPLLWKRLRTLGGPYVREVALFCYYGQHEISREQWAQGKRPDIRNEVGVAEAFKSWCQWRPWVRGWRPRKRYRIAERFRQDMFFINSADRYLRSVEHKIDMKYKEVLYEGAFEEGGMQKLLEAAPTILLKAHRVPGDKPIPDLKYNPGTFDTYQAMLLWQKAYKAGKLNRMADGTEMFEEVEYMETRWERVRREKHELWTATLTVPQPTDGFKSIWSYNYDPCEEETDHEEEERQREVEEEDAAKEEAHQVAYNLNDDRYNAQKFVDGDYHKRKDVLSRIAVEEPPARQDQIIKELNSAIIRTEKKRKLYEALYDFRNVKRQREVVWEAYEELANPDCGTDFVYEWKPTDLQRYRAEVEANVAAVQRQLEYLAAAESGKAIWDRKRLAGVEANTAEADHQLVYLGTGVWSRSEESGVWSRSEVPPFK